MIDKYICRICNKQVGAKGFPLHAKTHGLTFKEYVKDHIEDFKPLWKICPICNENVTDKNACSKKCGYILRSKLHKGVNIWDRMDEKTKIKAKESISNKASVRQKGRNIWSEMSKETKIEAKRKLSKRASEKVGDKNPMYGKKQSPETIQKIFSKRPLNTLEILVANFLDDNGIEYYYNFFISKESTHSYDFKIKDTNIIIEIDGDYWHGNPNTKNHFWDVETTKRTDLIKESVAKERGFKLLRFWESDIKKDFELVKCEILQVIEREINGD